MSQRHLWALITILLLIGCRDFASDEASPLPEVSTEASARARQASPTLWRVEDPRGSEAGRGRLHLLGSIHLGPPKGWSLPESTLAHLDAAEALVVEIDERSESLEEHDDIILEYALLPIGTTLKDKIPAELYARLRARIDETRQPIMGLDQLRPWMVAVSLAVSDIVSLGYSPEEGLDVRLIQRARTRHQPIIALENTRQQLALLAGMPDDIQILMLEEALAQSETEGYFDELKEAWRIGDDDALDSLLLQEIDENPKFVPFYEVVFFERNESMRARLEELLATGKSYFVVVGAGHLSGERGIPRLFADRGFSVVREPGGEMSR